MFDYNGVGDGMLDSQTNINKVTEHETPMQVQRKGREHYSTMPQSMVNNNVSPRMNESELQIAGNYESIKGIV